MAGLGTRSGVSPAGVALLLLLAAHHATSTVEDTRARSYRGRHRHAGAQPEKEPFLDIMLTVSIISKF